MDLPRRRKLLTGGYINESGVSRSGRYVVRRQDHPWPAAVGQALNLLHSRGFNNCPEEIERTGKCSAVLTYMPGRALPSPVPTWAASPATLYKVTRFLKSFSLAAEGVGDKLTHSDWLIAPMSDGKVFVHGDPHPTNIVFNIWRRPTAIIDFELATLGTHEWNLVSLIFSWAPLEPVHLTCWKHVEDIPVKQRVKSILKYWQCETAPASLLETASSFTNWRRTWIAELARFGNPGAAAFLADANFDYRYRYAIDELARSLC
jgi:Phosphotransferase enzyme family